MLLVATFIVRRRRLRDFARAVTRHDHTAADRALSLARTVFARVPRRDDPPFLFSFPQVLGASPLDILKVGGCCSGTHRLYIAALHTLGIRAAQITVYNAAGSAVHCLTQVTIDGQPRILDVDYGVTYRHPGGSELGLRCLQRGVIPSVEPFAVGLSATHTSGLRRGPGYPHDPYYSFDYAQTKTANWTQSRWRRALYALMRRSIGSAIDQACLHPLLEWPELLLVLLLSLPGGLLVGSLLIG